jgi:hypothetical protein
VSHIQEIGDAGDVLGDAASPGYASPVIYGKKFLFNFSLANMRVKTEMYAQRESVE